MTAGRDDALRARAVEFAADVTTTLRGVLGPGVPEMVLETTTLRGDRTRISIKPAGEKSPPIPLTIDGEVALYLGCRFQCEWDREQRFLKMRKADFYVLSTEVAEPLFRYEYVDDMSPLLPSAHLQVHAHRDEFLYTMIRAQSGKARARRSAVVDGRRGKMPRLAKVHFPLGGPRMRPCLEDVLQMLIQEFHVDCESGAQDVIDRGRAVWRRKQAGTITRDMPEEAARVLAELGYGVTAPPSAVALSTAAHTRI